MSALWLVVEEGALAGTTLRLGTEPVVIGRDRGADLRMDAWDDRLVSARHARLTPSGDGWVLEDLGSRNGTLVDGDRIRGPRAVSAGDRIRLGNTGPVVLVTDDPAAATVRSSRRTPTTRTARAPSRARTPLLAGAVLVAILAVGVAFWAVRSASSPVDEATGSAEVQGVRGATPDGTGGAAPETETPAGAEAGTAGDEEGSGGATAREIAELRAQIAALTERIRRSEAESESLRVALDAAERRGAPTEEIRALEDRLADANAALRRQQLAASLDFEAIGAAVRPATTQIHAEFEGRHVVVATAFAVDREGRLLTNRHVVRDDGGRALLRIGIRYPGREGVVPARVAAVSPSDDLALVELTSPAGGLPAVPEINARADTLPAGTPLAVAGFPLGGDPTTAGGGPQPLLSAGVLVGRSGGWLEIEGYGRSGASGSPVVDADGRVVGIVVGGRTDEGGERLFALPASRVQSFLASVSGAR